MGKKKKAQRQTAPSAATVSTSAEKSSSWWLWLLLFSGIAAGSIWLGNNTKPSTKADGPLTAALQPANQCRRAPVFMDQLSQTAGFGRNASLSSSERDLLGMAVVESDPQNGQRLRHWQHPSWRQAGQLSSFAVDGAGNIYVIPAPRVNLADNPPALQNRVYKIDSSTAEMKVLLEFPVKAPVSQRNPFAGMGLSMDCAGNRLWLSTVAGSGPQQQLGQLLRIDLQDPVKAHSVLENFDGFGLAPFTAGDKRGVLLASARDSSLHRLWLDADGNANGKPERWLSIENQGPLGNERIRKVDISPDGQLVLAGVQFNFNLAQPSAQQQRIKYRFAWNAEQRDYAFVRWEL
jgi:hypothetical protein